MAPVVWILCKDGNLGEVRGSLSRGQDVNSKDDNNRTGLMWAVMHRHNSIVRLLLEQPTVDLNAVNNGGRTALHHAAEFVNAEAVQLLLADPRLNSANQKDNVGETPVSLAVKRSNENEFRQLASHPSVDLDTRDGEGKTLDELAR